MTLHDASDISKPIADSNHHLSMALYADAHPATGGFCDAKNPRGPSSTAVESARDKALGLPSLHLIGDTSGKAEENLPKSGCNEALIESAQHKLGGDKASSRDKLATVEALAKAGLHHIEIADKDGQKRDYTIETETAGKNTMVHLFSKDGQGKEHIVLRGIDHGGTFKKEVSNKGQAASFEGSDWAKVEQNKSTVGTTDDRPTTPSQPSKFREKTEPAHDKTIAPAKPFSPTPPDVTPATGPILSTHEAKATGYYPANNRMEGGTKDRHGNPLYTLQQYLDGKAPYVSVAMDNKAGIPYGQKVNIPELNDKYGQNIPFRVVDTGSAFRGKGTGRIDICTSDRRNSLSPDVNGRLTLQFVA